MLNFCEFCDCRETMRRWIGEGVRAQMCVTSPPYWGLRDYGTAKWEGGNPDCQHTVGGQVQDNKAPGAITTGQRPGVDASQCRKCGARRVDSQLGIESTPDEYVRNMVEVFRLVRDLLADDGVLFLNLGDSYWGGGRGGNPEESEYRKQATNRGSLIDAPSWSQMKDCGLKPKDLIGIPWSVAKALQAPYYTGRMKVERDRVWLAAMIDGEGTICGFDHDRADNGTHRSGIHIFITNSCAALLDEATRIWPTSRSEHGRPGPGHLGGLPTWRWIVHGIDNKLAVLRELYPYLIAKRQQAIVAYSMLLLMADAKRLGHSAQKDATIAKRAVCTALLSDLNHQRPVTMPDWLTEPPSLFEPGWYLRQDIIWAKPNPMPESVRDRCTKSHEYIFLLSKNSTYYYDADAIAEPISESYANANRPDGVLRQRLYDNSKYIKSGMMEKLEGVPDDNENRATTRNKRSVWAVPTVSYAGAHFATFPPALIEPCILAGSRPGDTVLDPFMGSGTTGQVAQDLGRQWLGCELNPDYEPLQKRRTEQLGMVLA